MTESTRTCKTSIEARCNAIVKLTILSKEMFEFTNGKTGGGGQVGNVRGCEGFEDGGGAEGDGFVLRGEGGRSCRSRIVGRLEDEGEERLNLDIEGE